MIIFQTSNKSAPQRDPRIVHIEQWQQLADKKREDALGTNFFEDTRDMFCLDSRQIAPRFRPAIRMPELQMLCMKEANDLSEFAPQAYIYNQRSDERVEKFEKSFLAQWHMMNLPYHLLFAFLASQFVGTGFLQFGIDPYARRGKGKMWVKWRESKSVHPDPNADYTCNWSYISVDDWVHLDEVKRRFPERAKWLPKASTNVPSDIRDTGSSGFRLPEGPWQQMPPFNEISSSRGNSSRLRTTFCLDYGREMLGDLANLPEEPGVAQKFRWKYPRGRVVIDCEGVVVADGQCPLMSFPLIPVWATPPLYGVWAVPPTRYSLSLQDLAERIYAQTYENLYRLNNGIWLLPAGAQIDQGKFGGIPGEKCTYEGNQPPQLVTPPAFPESATKMPELLLEKQRQIHGFTQARQGNPGSGNISPDLFDAAVLRGQSMTQLRGRLASNAVLDLSKLIAYTMLEFMPDQKMPLREGAELSIIDYVQPKAGTLDDYEMFLDDGSFHVKSQAVVQKLAEALGARGIIPPDLLLEMVGYPGAAKVGTELKTRSALAAVTAAAEGRPAAGRR